jgi:hypothetical protein
MTQWHCTKCGKELPDEPAEKRKPCPNCGSTARSTGVTASISIARAVHLKTHSKHRDGSRKIVREEISGDDFHRQSGRWNLINRLIDRANDWYQETFRSEETGEIIHYTAEPLSNHQGHGSAKSKAQK